MSMGEIENSSDCQSLVLSIEEQLITTPTISQISQRPCCIYRVPKLVRKVNEEAYTPVLVSIGPFHHKNERLHPMDAHKLIYLKSFIENSKTNLIQYLEIIKNKESEIRECYAEPIDMCRDEFIQMILIDSIFVIEILRTGEAVIPFTKGEILHDLSLAENQLPFFILKDFYRAAFIPDDHMNSTSTESFTHLACECFMVNKRRVQVDPITNEAVACLHLLDLLRSHHLQSSSSSEHEVDVDKTSILCPTATSLYEAGVKFRVSDKASRLLDIHFDKEEGILTIPKFESFYINLLAFEQCHYNSTSTYITNYHYFMDCLINTGEDVQLLANAGIIGNWLGTYEQVADLFNTLVSQAYISPRHYCYASITQQLNNHCNKRWNRDKTTLKQKYFNHPWAVISVIYAVTLLLLTITQVVTGILAVPGVKK